MRETYVPDLVHHAVAAGSIPLTSGFLSTVHFVVITKRPFLADPWSEPIALPARYRACTTSHTVAAPNGSTNFPLSRARAQENGTNLKTGS